MKKYKVVQIGLGNRGKVHLESYLACQERFDVVGIYDINQNCLKDTAEKYNIENSKIFYDADHMLSILKPDIISFVTNPGIRKEYFEMAARYGVKGILFEKPMATSLEEAKYITDLCNKNEIKAIVCHQHKYLSAFRKLKQFLDSGELGKVYKIDAECQSWASQIATHYIDYILWANEGIGAESVIGHIHGTKFLEDAHPSPEYIMGEIKFKNGIRANIQCGYFSQPHSFHQADYEKMKFDFDFWTDCRLTVYGKTGYAWAECNGNWGAFTSRTNGNIDCGKCGGFVEEVSAAQIRYANEFADWMDDDRKVHSCNINQAYEGYQILEAIYMSALDKQRVDLPLVLPLNKDLLGRMKTELKLVEYSKAD